MNRFLFRRRFFVLLFVAGIAATVGSPTFALSPEKQVTQYTLTTWQAKDGLPQETTTAITQAVDGAIWIGTPSGLIRFDGVRFRRHPLPPGAGPGDHYVTGLLTDSGGDLWITTRGDLFRLRNGRFSNWGVDSGLPAGGALGIIQLDDGTLALATDQGVVTFDPASQSARLLEVDQGARSSALTVARGQSGRIWGGAMRGLLQLETVSGNLPVSIDFSGQDIVNAVLEDSQGRLWVGTSMGLSLVRGDRELEVPELDVLAGLWIRCLLQDRDGMVWIGTRGNGAFRFNEGRLERFGPEEGLPDTLVRQIFEDRDGSLWFVTAGGLAHLRDGAATPWTVREGLPVPFVWSVYADPESKLWVGTSGGGVVRLEDRRLDRPDFFDRELEGVEIRSFLTDHEGALWIGTSGNGLARVRDATVQWIRWAPPAGRNTVYSLLEDHEGRLWVGTGNGLGRLEDGRAVTWFSRTDARQPTVVRSLAEDASGRIWVGTTAGLFRVGGEGLVPVPGAAELSRVRIHCIRFEKNNTVWLATDAGLGRLENGRLDLIGTEQGLPNRMLYWILDDPSGHFWISNDLGVMRIDKDVLEDFHRGLRDSVEVLVIGREDGMPSTECNSGFPGGARRSDGAFCFATTNGVGCIDPALVRALEAPPDVGIEEILIDGLVVRHGGTDGPGSLEIPAGARRVEIRYGAVSLTAAEKLSFRYRLEGFDPDWIEVGRTRVAHFTGLPPGRLQFSVTARHGNGPWSLPPAVLDLEVRPSFLQTPWFYIMIAASIALAAWLTYRIRTAQLRAGERRLRKLVALRTVELENANTELARLAIVDPLTGLANRRRFDTVLQAEWNRALRNRTQLSLLMIDIDHFKAFNDHLGHLAGDRRLKGVADVLAENVRRPGDLAARYGGEEFVILLPETDAHSATVFAEKTRRSVEASGFPHPSSSTAPVVTVSVGWSNTVPENLSEAETLIAVADEALYRAKENRNCVVGLSFGKTDPVDAQLRKSG